MKRFLSFILLVLALSLAHQAPAGEGGNRQAKPEAYRTGPGPQQGDAAKRKYFTDLKLVTQEGKEVRFYSDILKDRVVLLSFFYVNCKTDSPRQNMVLSRVRKMIAEHLGKEVLIVSITVDPARDNPEKIRDYARVFDAQNGWLFLTGKKENVDWVNYRLGQYSERPEDHSLIYLLGNLKTDHWVKLSKDAKAETLAGQIRSLVAENRNLP